MAAAAAAAALTAASADNPAGSDVDALKKQKGLRRLDTNADDLLEAFLENEGKILRLPVEDNSQINISDLAKVRLNHFLKNYEIKQIIEILLISNDFLKIVKSNKLFQFF